MRIKKTVWIFAMLMLTAILVLIVNSRIQLTGEVIFGGNNDVFIKTDNLKKPLDDYQKPDDTNKIVAPEGLDYPNIDISKWQYILVNDANSISTYTPETMEAGSTGLRMDERVVSSLEKLLDAAKDAGYTPYVGTAYVSYSQQQKQFNAKATELSEDADYSYDEGGRACTADRGVSGLQRASDRACGRYIRPEVQCLRLLKDERRVLQVARCKLRRVRVYKALSVG